MTRAHSISTAAVVCLATLAALAVAAFGYVEFSGWNADSAGAAARYTARFSFLWFLAAWSAGALATLRPGGWRAVMLRRRRAIGLGFAAAHFVHLAALLIAVLLFGSQASAKTVYGGGAGYVFVALMALTSNNWSMRALGSRNWKLLHTLGALTIAVIFAVSYLGRVEDKPWLAIPALTLLGGVVLLKLAASLKTARTARSRVKAAS
jgi:methionine sulfoxide reductase heme-binding subunit